MARSEILHDVEARRFVARVEGAEAVLQYAELPDSRWDMLSTFVPPSHRRRGIATELVRHSLDEARERGLTIIPSCWFVADFVDDFPEYRAVVAG